MALIQGVTETERKNIAKIVTEKPSVEVEITTTLGQKPLKEAIAKAMQAKISLAEKDKKPLNTHYF